MVYRGKRIVMIREVGGELFEAAYFVLREDKKPIIDDENVTRDLVCEANRIIEDSFGKTRKRRKMGYLFPFVSFILGVGVALLLALSLKI